MIYVTEKDKQKVKDLIQEYQENYNKNYFVVKNKAFKDFGYAYELFLKLAPFIHPETGHVVKVPSEPYAYGGLSMNQCFLAGKVQDYLKFDDIVRMTGPWEPEHYEEVEKAIRTLEKICVLGQLPGMGPYYYNLDGCYPFLPENFHKRQKQEQEQEQYMDDDEDTDHFWVH